MSFLCSYLDVYGICLRHIMEVFGTRLERHLNDILEYGLMYILDILVPGLVNILVMVLVYDVLLMMMLMMRYQYHWK
jgi:hypothetical protein